MKKVILLLGLLVAVRVEAATMGSDTFNVRGASFNAGSLSVMSPVDLAPGDPGYIDVGGTAGPGAGAGPSSGWSIDSGAGFWHVSSALFSGQSIDVPEPHPFFGLLIGSVGLMAMARRRANEHMG